MKIMHVHAVYVGHSKCDKKTLIPRSKEEPSTARSVAGMTVTGFHFTIHNISHAVHVIHTFCLNKKMIST